MDEQSPIRVAQVMGKMMNGGVEFAAKIEEKIKKSPGWGNPSR